MKIAIVEWWPRLCGAVAWAAHLASANGSDGHQVDLLTFSKSGRLLKPWEKVPGNWQVRPLGSAVAILNDYDLVILSDIVCRAPEVKKDDVPYYVAIIEALTVPWTTMIHDGSYAGKESDTMRLLLRTPSFSGRLITTRLPEAKARIDKLDAGVPITWIADPYLPYAFTSPIEERAHTREVIHVGRLSTNKGQDALLDLFRDLRANVNLWGYCAYGMPSHGWLLWELATRHLGLTEREFPVTTMPRRKNPNMHKFYTGAWSVTNQHGFTLRYHGGWGADIGVVDWSPAIALALTNDGWKGTLEYATLDAIERGCVAVVPAQQIEYAAYETMITVPYERCSYKITQDKATGETTLKSPTARWDRPAILSIITDLLDLPDAQLDMRSREQRAEVFEKHQPARILALITQAHQ